MLADVNFPFGDRQHFALDHKWTSLGLNLDSKLFILVATYWGVRRLRGLVGRLKRKAHLVVIVCPTAVFLKEVD